jgi:hypothetical protein
MVADADFCSIFKKDIARAERGSFGITNSLIDVTNVSRSSRLSPVLLRVRVLVNNDPLWYNSTIDSSKQFKIGTRTDLDNWSGDILAKWW